MTNCENGQLFTQIASNTLNMPLYAIYQISDSSYLRNRHNVDKVFNLQCFKYRCDGRCNGGNVQVATGELQYHPLSSKLLHKSALLSSERTFSKSTCNHRHSLTECYTFTLCLCTLEWAHASNESAYLVTPDCTFSSDKGPPDRKGDLNVEQLPL